MTLDQIKEAVELYFQDRSPAMAEAAEKLWVAGWEWDDIRPLMAAIYNAGRESDR